jgi:hypothetical protein
LYRSRDEAKADVFIERFYNPKRRHSTIGPLGADTLVFTTMSGHPVAARVRPDVRPAPSAQVMLRLDLKRAHLFDAATGQAVGPTPH